MKEIFPGDICALSNSMVLYWSSKNQGQWPV